MSAWLPYDPDHVPTVEEVLLSLEQINWRGDEPVLAWDSNGSRSGVPISELRDALNEAYDSSMPNWVALVQLDDEDFGYGDDEAA
jgi:hypothetical protein